MNNNNVKIKPISNPEVLQIIEVLKTIIREGNGIFNFIETVSNLEVENPMNYESIKRCESPTQNTVTIFSTSPIKSRKSISGVYSTDSGTTKFNNRKILTFVKYSLIMKLQNLVKYITQWDNLVSIDTSEIIECCLQCVIFVVSMSVIIEDIYASNEEGANDKGKITVKGKRYIMNTIYKIRLYLISLINDIKTATADDILFKYHPHLLDNKDLTTRKQKSIKIISDINNIINNELKNYSSNGKNNDHILRGCLQKKNENEKFMSGFKKKYFVLTHKALMYSDKEITENTTLGMTKFLMFCDYDSIERVQEESIKKKYCMRLFSSKDPNQSIYLAAGDEIEEILWFNEIRDKMYINSKYYTSEDINISESER